MLCGFPKVKKVAHWCPPPNGVFKFKVEGVVKGKPGPAGIGGALSNHKGEVLYMFSKAVGIIDSIEAEVLAILEVPRFYVQLFSAQL